MQELGCCRQLLWLVQVKAPAELHFSEEADEQEYWRARLLQPAGLAAYTAQQARMESQAAAASPAEEAKDAAGEAGPTNHEELLKVPEEAAAVKSEPREETVVTGRGVTAVGSLGRVKVPKAAFRQ